MPQHEHDYGYSDIDSMHTPDMEPSEGLDQWQLSDFEDLLPARI